MTNGLKVTFLGVGEAFDEALSNTSLLVQTPMTTVLLDCGFSTVQRVWETLPDPEALDAVYLSHTHADHLFGLPSLLVRYAEEGREKPLTVLGRPGLADHVRKVCDFAYPGIANKLSFQLRFGVLDAAGAKKPEGTSTLNADDTETILNDLWISVAPTKHSVPSMAVKLEWMDMGSPPRTICYSGDGMWTKEAAKLYEKCDLLVHECYLEEGETWGHASVDAVVELYKKVRPKQMALVHLRRTLRPKREELLEKFKKEGLNIIIPMAGEVVQY